MSSTLDFYDSNARELTRAYDSVDLARLTDTLLTLVPPPARLLDIGCGSGRDAARALAQGYDVTVVDGSEAMLREAVALHPELAGRTRRLVLPSPLPFEPESLDAVTSWATLMHLRPFELPSVYVEIRRVLRPGGAFAYSVNTARPGLDPTGADSGGRHFTCVSPAAWEEAVPLQSMLNVTQGSGGLQAASARDPMRPPRTRWQDRTGDDARRRGWDSNPRTLAGYTLSKRAH